MPDVKSDLPAARPSRIDLQKVRRPEVADILRLHGLAARRQLTSVHYEWEANSDKPHNRLPSFRCEWELQNGCATKLSRDLDHEQASGSGSTGPSATGLLAVKTSGTHDLSFWQQEPGRGCGSRKACCRRDREHRPGGSFLFSSHAGRANPRSTCHRSQSRPRETRGPARVSRMKRLRCFR